jgi:thymidylate synthase
MHCAVAQVAELLHSISSDVFTSVDSNIMAYQLLAGLSAKVSRISASSAVAAVADG